MPTRPGATNIWVEYAGHAVREPELVRDLYAVAAEEWFARGRDKHYALVPATDPELVDAWFRLSLRRAARGGDPGDARVDGRPRPRASPSGARRADDLEAAIALDRRAPAPPGACARVQPDRADRDHRRGSRAVPGRRSTTREVALFLAEIDGQARRRAADGPGRAVLDARRARPPRARRVPRLTRRRSRRRAARARASRLTERRRSRWAREQGYPVTVVDWRETNLLASRFWPARGFRRTFLRLYRSIP